MVQTKQNAFLTFKYNQSLGRHGWLRLTPAYSVKMVETILDKIGYVPRCVFEPFSGTGTTELVCANKGIDSFAFDVNPFLVWLAKTKTSVYNTNTIERFISISNEIAINIDLYSSHCPPPIHNIERWWEPTRIDYLSRLKTAIKSVDDSDVSDLLKIAFCRVIISLSNAAFNHVSTSFSDNANAALSVQEYNELFLLAVHMISETVTIQPQSVPKIYNHDSICIPTEYSDAFDTIITSPPYPNRISYIRELRPYMYWLDYLCSAEDASNLDWKTIGGTWGSATSKLSTWTYKSKLLPDFLFEIANNISKAENKSAPLMANYVLKYFDDMAMHIESAHAAISNNGTVHYIVGNSNFYGYSVPSDEIYKYILTKVGFSDAKSEIVRKRNCNKSLYEYWISARK